MNKFKTINNPNYAETFEIIEEGLRKKAMIVIFACFKVIYEGRAMSELGFGERIILIKGDGSFLVHQDKKVDPVNWQPPKSRSRVFIKDDKVFLESYRRSPEERIKLEIRKTYFVNYSLVEDLEELEMAGYEKDMGDMIMKHPDLIEKGFRPTSREYSTEHGFIDILGKDTEDNIVILELKSRKAGVTAVKQIRRYLKDFEDDKHGVRGILVAPGIVEDAKELLEEENIEFKELKPPRELKRDKKVTLDAFG